MTAVEIVHQLLGCVEVMTTAHVLQAPVGIIRIIAEHDDHSVGIILGDDLHNRISLQIQSFPQVSDRFSSTIDFTSFPDSEKCVARCSRLFRNIFINATYKDIPYFPATSCYRTYADRNSVALIRYPRSNVVAPPPRLGRLRTTVAKLRRA